MKVARVYLNPNGEQWVDFPMPENAVLMAVWGQVMADGVCISPVAIVPKAAVHHVILLEMQDGGTNLTVFPGGKLN